jgi:hypothetical protein
MARPGLEPGHHDFQGVAAGGLSRRNPCKSGIPKWWHRGVMLLASAGFPYVWDSMEGVKSQTPADDLLGAIHQLRGDNSGEKCSISRAFAKR